MLLVTGPLDVPRAWLVINLSWIYGLRALHLLEASSITRWNADLHQVFEKNFQVDDTSGLSPTNNLCRWGASAAVDFMLVSFHRKRVHLTSAFKCFPVSAQILSASCCSGQAKLGEKVDTIFPIQIWTGGTDSPWRARVFCAAAAPNLFDYILAAIAIILSWNASVVVLVVHNSQHQICDCFCVEVTKNRAVYSNGKGSRKRQNPMASIIFSPKKTDIQNSVTYGIQNKTDIDRWGLDISLRSVVWGVQLLCASLSELCATLRNSKDSDTDDSEAERIKTERRKRFAQTLWFAPKIS